MLEQQHQQNKQAAKTHCLRIVCAQQWIWWVLRFCNFSGLLMFSSVCLSFVRPPCRARGVSSFCPFGGPGAGRHGTGPLVCMHVQPAIISSPRSAARSAVGWLLADCQQRLATTRRGCLFLSLLLFGQNQKTGDYCRVISWLTSQPVALGWIM